LALLKPRTWPRQARLALIAAISLAGLIFLFVSPRVPIGPDYHDFADKSAWMGIPNALDVVSNIPFVLAGMWGLWWLERPSARTSFLDRRERVPYRVFFAGVALTGVGSLWYHLAPSDARLPWDLLPMTCSFTSMVVVTYMERVNLRTGYLALVPALLLGILSVVYWVVTNWSGRGEYKFYLFVQFFSPVLLVLIIGLFPPRYSGIRYLVAAFGLYIAAKLFEVYDYAIYRALGRSVSGHSLKHVTAGIACLSLLLMLQNRRPAADESTINDPHLPEPRNAVSL
jgi:hypothetical protein